jgi:hypothetical protein
MMLKRAMKEGRAPRRLARLVENATFESALRLHNAAMIPGGKHRLLARTRLTSALTRFAELRDHCAPALLRWAEAEIRWALWTTES